jgi:hypothetical protein
MCQSTIYLQSTDPDQHAAYAASWTQILENQPLEIFRAAADGEKIHTYLETLEQQQSVSADELHVGKSEIIKEYDCLVKSQEARRELGGYAQTPENRSHRSLGRRYAVGP